MSKKRTPQALVDLASLKRNSGRTIRWLDCFQPFELCGLHEAELNQPPVITVLAIPTMVDDLREQLTQVQTEHVDR